MKFRLYVFIFLAALSRDVFSQTADSLKYTVLSDKEFIAGFRASSGAILIDARAQKDYRKSRIEGAVNIDWPLPENYFTSAAAPAKGKPVFIYCYAGFRSRKVSVLFYDHGYRELYSLKGGFNGWKAHKMPVDRKRHPHTR
ncbi:MAG TPA: rhodanese-like domain-containing protein [Bacteroidales bacterium]|nr:rhodanese-like domain-containing protein [Bacteroidales bacterium]